MDFEPWEIDEKATFAPRSISGWPIGITAQTSEPKIALIEGTGDFLGAYSLASSLGILDSVLPVAVSNANVRIWEPALNLFKGKIIRISHIRTVRELPRQKIGKGNSIRSRYQSKFLSFRLSNTQITRLAKKC
jgi:hypothetical protein